MSNRLRHQVLKSSWMKLLQIGLGMASSLVLARWLGPAGFGHYSFALAAAGTLAVLAMTGWPVVVSREVAKAMTLEHWAVLRGVQKASNRMVAWTSLGGVAVGLALAAVLLGRGGHDGAAMALAALTIPATAFAGLRAATLRGLGKVLQGQALDALIRPAVLLALVLACWWVVPASPRLAVGLQVVATTLTFGLGLWLVRRAVPAPVHAAAPSVDRAWYASLVPLTFVAGVQVLSAHAPLLLLGAMAPAEQVGLYRVAVAVSTQVAFAMWPINAVFAPHVVRAHVKGELGELRRIVARGRLFGLAIAVPAVAAIVLVGKPALVWLLGPDFAGAFVPLLILSAGQLLAMMAGPIGPVLGMTGNERKVARATAVSLVLSLGLGLLLIPWLAATGAALASAIAMAVMRSMLLHYARQVLDGAPAEPPR